jgi:hypothetical protein
MGSFFATDYFQVKNKRDPVFCIKIQLESGPLEHQCYWYSGAFYHVTKIADTEKNETTYHFQMDF